MSRDMSARCLETSQSAPNWTEVENIPAGRGRLLRLSGRYAKVRRDGYRKKFGEPNRIVAHDSGRLYPEAIIFTTTAPQEVKNR
jgi:hypothetical protein